MRRVLKSQQQRSRCRHLHPCTIAQFAHLHTCTLAKLDLRKVVARSVSQLQALDLIEAAQNLLKKKWA